MRIDLKRGLIRTWVVIAVAWIGLTGWNEYSQKPNLDLNIRLEGECWDRLAKWPDGTPITNPFEIFDEPEPSQLPTGFKLDRNLWRAEIRQKLSDCEAAAAPIMQRVSVKVSHIWSSLKDSLPIILGPPLALLIAGYIIGWVVRGFRVQA